MKPVLVALALGALGLPVFAQAQQETTIRMEDVPLAARAAAESHARGVRFEKVQVDDDEGTRTYEFSGQMDNGLIYEVDVLADGTVEEIEEEIGFSMVPQDIQDVLKAQLPGFDPRMIARSSRPDGSIFYEFRGTRGGQEIDVEVNAVGAQLMPREDSSG